VCLKTIEVERLERRKTNKPSSTGETSPVQSRVLLRKQSSFKPAEEDEVDKFGHVTSKEFRKFFFKNKKRLDLFMQDKENTKTEGEMEKLYDKRKGWKKHFFQLKDDELRYWESKKGFDDKITEGKLEIADVSGYTCQEDGKNFGIKFVKTNLWQMGPKLLQVRCDSSRLQTMWLGALNSKETRRRSSIVRLSRSSSNPPPLMLKADDAESKRAWFEHFDYNKDGVLQDTELQTALCECCTKEGFDIAKIPQLMKVNGMGSTAEGQLARLEVTQIEFMKKDGLADMIVKNFGEYFTDDGGYSESKSASESMDMDP
jgi:hypothetical protein